MLISHLAQRPSTRDMRDKKVSKGFTELSIKSLPPGKHFDASTPAFGMRVGKNRRTWIVQRGADRRIIRIGHYPALTLQDARKAAKALLASPLPTSKRVSFQQAYDLFNVVGCGEKQLWDADTERFRGCSIDSKVKNCGCTTGRSAGFAPLSILSMKKAAVAP